jgi:hypothetical protein
MDASQRQRAMQNVSAATPLYCARNTGLSIMLADITEEEFRVAGAIIAAQCDPSAVMLDREHCASIGGHIHIAEITTNGFAWRIPPEDRT